MIAGFVAPLDADQEAGSVMRALVSDAENCAEAEEGDELFRSQLDSRRMTSLRKRTVEHTAQYWCDETSLACAKNPLQFGAQSRNLRLNDVPHDIEVHAKIVVNEPVSHPRH